MAMINREILLEEFYLDEQGEPVCLSIEYTPTENLFRVTRVVNKYSDYKTPVQRWPFMGPKHEALRNYLLWRRADLYVGCT